MFQYNKINLYYECNYSTKYFNHNNINKANNFSYKNKQKIQNKIFVNKIQKMILNLLSTYIEYL